MLDIVLAMGKIAIIPCAGYVCGRAIGAREQRSTILFKNSLIMISVQQSFNRAHRAIVYVCVHSHFVWRMEYFIQTRPHNINIYYGNHSLCAAGENSNTTIIQPNKTIPIYGQYEYESDQ